MPLEADSYKLSDSKGSLTNLFIFESIIIHALYFKLVIEAVDRYCESLVPFWVLTLFLFCLGFVLLALIFKKHVWILFTESIKVSSQVCLDESDGQGSNWEGIH